MRGSSSTTRMRSMNTASQPFEIGTDIEETGPLYTAFRPKVTPAGYGLVLLLALHPPVTPVLSGSVGSTGLTSRLPVRLGVVYGAPIAALWCNSLIFGEFSDA